MATNDLSTHHFQRKISDFCEVRIAPVASQRVLDSIRPYLIGLVVHRRAPPIVSGRTSNGGQRRGFYTKWEEDMLMVAQALTRAEVGWIRQHPELLKKVQPIEGLIAPEEIEFAARDWHGACDAFHRHAANRSKEIQRVMRVHRDPFEPIMVVLESDSPLSEYRKITDEILKRMPDENR